MLTRTVLISRGSFFFFNLKSFRGRKGCTVQSATDIYRKIIFRMNQASIPTRNADVPSTFRRYDLNLFYAVGICSHL